MKALFSALFFGAALAAASPAGAITIVLSDNFDDGDVSDWAVSSSASVTAPVVTTNSDLFTSPGFSLWTYFDAPGGGTGAGIVRASRTFVAPVAGDYDLDLRARSSGCDRCVMSYDILVNDILLLRASEASTTFDTISLDLLGLSAGSHTITLGMHTTASINGRFRAQFDDVVISTAAQIPVGTPEPATMALFGVGLLGLAGLRRRGAQ